MLSAARVCSQQNVHSVPPHLEVSLYCSISYFTNDRAHSKITDMMQHRAIAKKHTTGFRAVQYTLCTTQVTHMLVSVRNNTNSINDNYHRRHRHHHHHHRGHCVVINTSHVKRLARWKEGGRWTAEGTSDGGRSMELPAPASVLSPANLYEELKGLKTKYRKFIVTCMRSVTVKLPLWTLWGHMGGVDVWLHKLTLAMGSDVWSSRPTRRTSSLTGSHCIVGWISPRASSDASQQRKISYHCRESNHVACSEVTIPTELSGSQSDGVTRKSWEAVT